MQVDYCMLVILKRAHCMPTDDALTKKNYCNQTSSYQKLYREDHQR